MPLKHFEKRFIIDSDVLWKSGLLTQFQKKIGQELFEFIVDTFTEFVRLRDESASGGYSRFSMVMGFRSIMPTESSVIWDRLIAVFYTDKQTYVDRVEVDKHIKKCTGTIMMACVAEDDRFWLFKDDPDKQQKKMDREIPDATEYFIANNPYKV